MRRGLAALAFALLLAFPLVAAQLPTETDATLAVPDWAEKAVPLLSPVETTLTYEMPCSWAVGSVGGLVVDLDIASAPSWATIVVNPPQFAATYDDCENDRIVRTSKVLAAVSDAAPADVPTEVKFEARVSDARGQQHVTEATAKITAAFHSVLDVSTPAAIKRVQPGEEATFEIDVTNFGNGDTRVDFEAYSATADVVPPAPVIIESRLDDEARSSATVTITALAPATPGSHAIIAYVNSTYVGDGVTPGDVDVITFTLTVAGDVAQAAGETKGKSIPGAQPVLGVALAVALALARRHV